MTAAYPDQDPRLTGEAPPLDPDANLRPVVAARRSDTGLWLTVGGAALLGVVAFLFLAARRTDSPEPGGIAAATTPGVAIAAVPPPPPELALAETAGRANGFAPLPGPTFVPPPYTPPAPPPQVIYASPGNTTVAVPSTAPSAQQRRNAPLLIVDLGGPALGGLANAVPAGAQADAAAQPQPGANTPGTSAGGAGLSGGEAVAALGAAGLAGAAGAGAAAGLAADDDDAPSAAGLNGDEQFASRIGGAAASPRVRATMLRNQSATVPQGAMIPGVLETALNSDLPGFARAVVSRDVRSFDGSAVLIPRGSRVIGQYRSAAAQGQSRAFIIWTRLIRPDGASIQLASSGTDDLGRAGLDGKVDRHFFQRFGGAILLSVLNAGVAAVGQQPSTQVVIGSSQQATGLASGLSPTDISPTIKVPQGAPIRIFVARDLDFSPVQGR